jgi:hypothetical protein
MRMVARKRYAVMKRQVIPNTGERPSATLHRYSIKAASSFRANSVSRADERAIKRRPIKNKRM